MIQLSSPATTMQEFNSDVIYVIWVHDKAYPVGLELRRIIAFTKKDYEEQIELLSHSRYISNIKTHVYNLMDNRNG
jgi:hypothetical protein